MLTKYYFAVIADGKIVGGVHFINDHEPKWGLFFKPKFSPFGISAVAFYFLDFCFSLTDTLYAMVQNKNQNALKFDLLFGFSVLKIDAKFHTLVQTKAEFNKHKQTALMQKIAKTSENFKIEFC
ncbi:hypothetical protein LMG7974_00799 [Campylobacter majalis]|uniref:N-acetyltransferase n=1 Tax=Campylobacter majalis TaxID=2790656 RepID=A0ABM8Q548_9BACT|nr:hypothetical protein [Campylobacter majalis]CAD7288033.1 hypothetical protein LMG7974_00799 [Campylobacter majalis]